MLNKKFKIQFALNNEQKTIYFDNYTEFYVELEKTGIDFDYLYNYCDYSFENYENLSSFQLDSMIDAINTHGKDLADLGYSIMFSEFYKLIEDRVGFVGFIDSIEEAIRFHKKHFVKNINADFDESSLKDNQLIFLNNLYEF